jgi:hypothetical protein
MPRAGRWRLDVTLTSSQWPGSRWAGRDEPHRRFAVPESWPDYPTGASAYKQEARSGVTLMWALLAALWYPWIDYGKSYRGVALSLRQTIAGGECIAGSKLGDPQRASLEYFSGIVTIRSGHPEANRCPLLLIQGTARDDTAPDGWHIIWEGNRPGDRSERLRLYRRNPA